MSCTRSLGRTTGPPSIKIRPYVGEQSEALPRANFIVNGAAPPANPALGSLSGELHMTPHWTLLAKLDGEFALGAQTYAGTTTARYTW